MRPPVCKERRFSFLCWYHLLIHMSVRYLSRPMSSRERLPLLSLETVKVSGATLDLEP